MAKFYLTDVPTTPKASSRSRPANIPKEPYQVQGRPPTMPQINAKVADINIEKNIPSLMQKELPREVSSGLVEGVQETGRAQARAGQASAAAAEQWGKAAQSMSESLTEVAVYLQRSKDYADKSRLDNAWNEINDEFDETVSTGKLNAMQAKELWPEYEAKLNGLIEPMNLSKHVRDTGIPKLAHEMARKRIGLQNGMREEQVDSDTAAIDTSYKTDLSQGKIDSAIDKIDDMIDAKLINKGQGEKRKAEAYVAYDEWRATTDITAAPREALPDLERATQTGKSKTYKHLPISTIIQLRNFAKSEIERKETESLNSIANQVAANKIKTPEEIDAAAGGNVEARKLVPLKNQLNQDTPYSQEAMAKIETGIFTYTKEAPETGSPEYHRILDQIHTTAPKAEWERLTSDLNKKRNEDKDALPGEDWYNPLVKDIENLTEDGLFTPRVGRWAIDPRGPKPAWTAKDLKDPEFRLKHKDEIEDMWKQSRSIQIQMREWRKLNPGNDHKTQDEAYKFRNDLLKSQGADAGRAPIRKAITPTTGVMGTPEPTGPTTSSAVPASSPQRIAATPEQAKKLANVNPDLLARLEPLQQKFGKLNINSGYRDPEHNKRVGGAKGSQHIQGNAVDISVKGMSIPERLALIQAATDAGITGIGVYDNALHFDVGQRRAWGPDYHFASVPSWAKGAISRHLGG